MKCLLLLFVLMKLHRHGDTTAYLNDTVLYTEGAIFPKEQAYLTTTVSSSCECRKLCIEDERCRNYCWTSYAEFARCGLSELKAQNLTRVPRTNSGSGLKIPYVDNGFLGEDGFLYVTVTDATNFTEAERQCSSQNGFHVGVYKTQIQLNILKSVYNMYQKEIWVDMDSLANNSNAYAVWADGTPFNATEIFNNNLATLSADEAQNPPTAKFRYNGNAFIDRAASQGSFYALCQLDPSTV